MEAERVGAVLGSDQTAPKNVVDSDWGLAVQQMRVLYSSDLHVVNLMVPDCEIYVWVAKTYAKECGTG